MRVCRPVRRDPRYLLVSAEEFDAALEAEAEALASRAKGRRS